MAYIGLLVAPIAIALVLFMAPGTRSDVWNAVRNGSSDIASRSRAFVVSLERGPGILERITSLQRQLAAYVLRHAADSLDDKRP